MDRRVGQARSRQRFGPTLTLIYLPHLDYNLQRLGPSDPATARDLGDVDAVAGDLISFYESRGAHVVVLSEYGLVDVSRPVHLNRAPPERGSHRGARGVGRRAARCRRERAFAVADHQVAHIYINDPAAHGRVRAIVEAAPGVERVLDRTEQAARHLDHERAGDLVAIAAPDAWFTYYYWLDDHRAPDFARTVDIHRKPGYDPVELVLDPTIRLPALKVGWTLAKKAAGFRYLMDVIPLDATLVKGSHGRPGPASDDGPLVIGSDAHIQADAIRSVDVYSILWAHLTGAT